MKLILFGATGMVGSGTLREALKDPEIETVLVIGRKSCGVAHPKLKEALLPDLFHPTQILRDLEGYNACIWALGISSIGLNEKSYAHITEELTLLWAHILLGRNPTFSLAYCSAMGAETTAMWGRVRQRVEDALQKMGFQHVGCVRPGMIQPGPGIKSKVWAYQFAILLFKPIFPLALRLFPSYVTNSERLGRAMIRIVQGRADKYILESSDINRVGR